jgi:hypothetical protein
MVSIHYIGVLFNAETLSDVWTGKITTWDSPRIQALNPDLVATGRLPALNITRYHSSLSALSRYMLVLTVSPPPPIVL